MRAVFLGAVLAGLIIGGVVAGVRLALDDDGTSAVSPGSSVTPGGSVTATATPDRGSPRGAAEAFAQAWAASDFAAMYLLLGAQSQFDYPRADFQAEYDRFATELTQTSLTAAVTDGDDSGATLAVHIETAYFGPFEYTTRLNLVFERDAWRIAWDRTAIHPDLQQGRQFVSEIERPSRGSIFARDGSPLAATQETRMLGVNRSVVSDRAAFTAAVVAFGFSQAEVDAAFASPLGQNQRVPIGPIPDDRAEAAATDLRPIDGVILYFDSQRVHPLGPAAAHVVGYTRELTADELAEREGQGYRIGDRIGATGLEESLDELLAGQIGATLQIVAADGDTVVQTVAERPFVDGQDVTTTLDAGVLQASQARLGERVGAAVIINPQTNEILALNSSPSFDPDAFERGDAAALAAITSAPNALLNNRATMGLYSAGSVFKLVTGAAGLVYAGYSTSDTLQCGATWNGVEPPRRNWEGAQGQLTIAQGLMRSCNPVFYEIGLQLYNKTDNGLSEMARLFGFGAPTGTVGLFDEGGLVPDAAWKRQARNEDWFPGDDVNLAIGQGDLLITPLQLANAYSTFVMRSLRSPVIVQGETAESRGGLPLTDQQWAHLQQGLELVTGPSGTANTVFALAGYNDFAGKSGTAEDTGEQQHVLFVAFSPRGTPTALAAVVLDDGQSGSTEAGPIARDIILAVND